MNIAQTGNQKSKERSSLSKTAKTTKKVNVSSAHTRRRRDTQEVFSSLPYAVSPLNHTHTVDLKDNKIPNANSFPEPSRVSSNIAFKQGEEKCMN